MSSAVGATSFRSRSLRQPHGLRSNPRAGPLEMPALEPKQGRRASFLLLPVSREVGHAPSFARFAGSGSGSTTSRTVGTAAETRLPRKEGKATRLLKMLVPEAKAGRPAAVLAVGPQLRSRWGGAGAE